MSTTPIDGAIAVNRRELLRGVIISLVIASALLVTAILPAEYGIDPLGIGRALGLTKLRQQPTEIVPASPGAAPPAAGPGASGGTQTARQSPAYRSDTREINLAPGKGLEIKTRLDKGMTLIYSWKTRDGSKVLHDFHGEPLGAKNDTFESFVKDAEASESRAYLVAPFDGTHGWYWKNKTSKPVTIELQVSGFYLEILNP